MGTVDCRIGHSMRLGAVAPRLRVRQSRLLGRRKEPSDIGGVVRGHDPTILDHRGPCVEGVDLPGARASTHNGAAMPRSTQVGAGDLGATRRVNDHRDSLRSGRLVNGGLPIADPCAVGGETGPDFVRR